MIGDMDNVAFNSSHINSSRQEALLYVFEDNDAVIKMIIKERSPTMRDVIPDPTELLLISCLTEPIWTPNKSNTGWGSIRRHTDQKKLPT